MLQSSGSKVVLASLVILASGYGLYRWLVVASIYVTSEPSRAIVSINGKRSGLTPFREDIASGAQRIEVEHSHYQIHRELIAFEAGDSVERHVVMTVGEGSLRLLSNPKGSWVEVDGERIPGVTPMRIDLSGGPHEILMGQAERKPQGEVIQVLSGKTVELNLELPISPHGTVTFVTEPQDATVELVGTDIQYQPKMRLPIGEYGVQVSRRGYETRQLRYLVRYGDNLKSVQLERQFGVLNVDVVPTDADVRVSFKQGGRTVAHAYQSGMRVPVGAVEVRARAMLHRTLFRDFTMSGKGHSLSLNLPAMNVSAGSTIRDKFSGPGGEPFEGPTMVVLPAGSFIMGNAAGPPSEKPAHRVTITQPFAMGQHEVTVGEFLLYLQATNKQPNAKLDVSNPQFPVHMVSWKQANAYTAWLSERGDGRYRLPTEAEWEYAARAGSNTDYFFGDRPEEACEYANLADRTTGRAFREWRVVDCEDGHVRMAPVAQLKPNAFGLYDMAGNVSEWVLECGMPNYKTAPNDGSVAKGPSCTSNGHRGGSWDSQPAELQSAYRNTSSSLNQDRGFRLVREL